MKVLGHPQRLAILRALMAGPATLSQLGERFGKTPAHIRHHLKALVDAGWVEPAPEHPLQNHLEKYYRASSNAFMIHLAVLPEPLEGRQAIVVGSKDRATYALAEYFRSRRLALQVLPLNSLDGLVALRQGVCHMATCHLLDSSTGEYNRPFVRHLFPGQAMAIVQLYRREEGLMVRPGNPLGIRDLEDITQPQVRFINRELGSGIRLWLDKRLKELGISPEVIHGYPDLVQSHTEVAQAVLEGRADVGVGIAASAREAGLDFIPLFDEPYELVLTQEVLTDPRYTPFFEHLSSGKYRTAIRKLDGYSVPSTAGHLESIS